MTAQPLSLLLQKLGSLVLSQTGKKKVKKSKGAAAASSSSSSSSGGDGGGNVTADLSHDVKAAVGAFVTLLTTLDGMLQSFIGGGSKGGSGGGGGASSSSTTTTPAITWEGTVVVGSDFEEQRSTITSLVRDSHKLSCERLVDLVQERINILQGFQ